LADGRPDRSFPSRCRLLSAADYRRVYRTGQRGSTGPFVWNACENNIDTPRLGLAVPKRVVRRAVDRSRIKRLIRESFRHHRQELPPVDIVVSVRSRPRDLYDPRLGGWVARIWDQAGAVARSAS